MRVAVFTDTFFPQVNGVTNTLGRMGDYFENNDVEYIFITPEQKDQGNLVYKVETCFSYPLLIYPECRFALPNMIRLTKKLDNYRPDIILAMTEFTMGLAALAYSKKRKIPIVSNYSTNFGTILNSYKLNLFEKSLEKYLSWFHNEANMTITPSVESQKKLSSIDVRKTKLFQRGIDYDKFTPENRDDEFRQELEIGDRVVLLFVGRLSPEKDLDILKAAMDILNEKYQDKISLVITGEGPMYDELKKSMPENVVFTGYKKGPELRKIYSSCDIFAFPSSFETFGNVVLEAFASGLPVVGVSKGGVKGLVKDGETGYLANPRDVASFAGCVEKLIKDNELRTQFGKNGRIYAKQNSWDSVFDNLMEIFEDTIAHFDQKKGNHKSDDGFVLDNLKVIFDKLISDNEKRTYID